MTFQLRAGIAGYGLSGRTFHGSLLKGSGFDVAAVMTKDPIRAVQAVQDFPATQIVSSIDELISTGIDLLVVASGNVVHVEQALAGINAGIPVVVEKPMALTLSDTQIIVDASKAKNVPVTVFFNRRWDSDSLTVKKVLNEGLIGEVFRVESRFERFRPEINPTSWREQHLPEDGGGLLLDLMPHLLSTTLELFGPAHLISSSVRSIRGASDDDVVLTLKHTSGVDSYLCASAIIGAPGPRLRVNGSKGTLIIQDLDPQEMYLRAGEYPVHGHWNRPTASPATLHYGTEVVEISGENGNYAIFYELVKGAIAGQNPWPVDVGDALEVATIIDQARAKSFR